MEHLHIHIAYEAKVGGPVQYRWMYAFERCMCSLKKMVRNKARPEGSIVEAYLIDELVYFSSRYFDLRVQTKFNRPDRNDDGGEVRTDGKLSVFAHPRPGRPFGSREPKDLSDEELEAATLYTLSNCEEVFVFIEEHKRVLKELHPSSSDKELQKEHNATFIKWFEKRVKNDDVVDKRLKALALGPSREVAYYDGFIVNGFRFHTKELESNRGTQNSGVLVHGCTFEGQERNYYGKLVRVIEHEFYGKDNSLFMFQCEWFDTEKGVLVDKYGITSVDTNSRHKPFEPFVIASQAVQVFYASPLSTKAKSWSTVITTKARNTYDVAESNLEEEETYQEEEFHEFDQSYNIDERTGNLTLVDNSQFPNEVDLPLQEEEQEEEWEEEEEEEEDEESDDDR